MAEILQQGQGINFSDDWLFSGQQISTDTRSINSGDLFIPLRGENFDGHHYIEQAINQGALLAVCEQNYYQSHEDSLQHLPLVLVENSLRTYQQLARIWKRKIKPVVIAITGSSGKTSTKEILGALLSHFGSVHKTRLNYNNEIGVPKTLLELNDDHQFCILEMGMRARGEIKELAEIGEPDIGIITNIGVAHIGELGSLENIAKAKWELAEVLEKSGGTCVLLNSEQQLLERASSLPNLKIFWCGTRGEGDGLVQSVELDKTSPSQRVTYQLGNKTSRILSFNLPGEHQVLNLLLCLGVLHTLELELPDSFNLSVPTIFGRNELLNTPAGIKILNDAYNANPDSMNATLNMFCNHYSGNKAAVLSVMGELGAESETYHVQLGQLCKTLPLQNLIVIGEDAKGIYSGAKGASFGLQYCDNQSQAIHYLKSILNQTDIILFKASRSAKLENLINRLINHE